MNLQVLKTFANKACDILKMGVNDGRFNELTNLIYIKFQYPDVLNDFIKLDYSLIIDNYKILLNNDEIFFPTNIIKPSILRDIMTHFNNHNVDKDCFGDVFEYLLSYAVSNQKNLGEFYTPQHIIQFMIKMIKPQAGETVLDPFCGTGGVLTECLKYNPDVIVHGAEITTNARVAIMNIILHGGDRYSGVDHIDSLENPIDGIYDCVITNMPFSQNVSLNVSAYYYNGLAKKSGDGVCILHCFKSIKKGGRMALLVPEGVLFKKTLSSVRQFLLENAKLELVVSLPQGVFLPYTGVKTSILYFTGCHEDNISTRDPILFYEVKNDGYTLDNHRRPIDDNDLKIIGDIDFSKLAVEYEKIKENDYNLIANRYTEESSNKNPSTVQEKWDMVKLGELLIPITKSDFLKTKKQEPQLRPVISQAKCSNIGNSNNNTRTVDDTPNNFPVIIFDDFTTSYKYINPIIDYTFEIESPNTIFLQNKNNNNLKYISYAMEIIKFKPSIHKRHWISEYSNFYIPIPPIETQQKIVEEFENIESIITSYEGMLRSFKREREIGLSSYVYEQYYK